MLIARIPSVIGENRRSFISEERPPNRLLFSIGDILDIGVALSFEMILSAFCEITALDNGNLYHKGFLYNRMWCLPL